MTLAEFFTFLYNNNLDYSVNILRNGVGAKKMRIAVSKGSMYIRTEPMAVRTPSINQIVFCGQPLMTIKTPAHKKPVSVHMYIRNGHVFTIDLEEETVDSDKLLELAKTIWNRMFTGIEGVHIDG